MRIPMRCLYDFRLGGSVCHIFGNIYRYKLENNGMDYTQMVKNVHTKLMDQKLFRRPAVFIQTKVSDDLRNRITQTCMDCECEITENIEHATHIIYPEIDHQDDFVPNTFNLSVSTQI